MKILLIFIHFIFSVFLFGNFKNNNTISKKIFSIKTKSKDSLKYMPDEILVFTCRLVIPDNDDDYCSKSPEERLKMFETTTIMLDYYENGLVEIFYPKKINYNLYEIETETYKLSKTKQRFFDKLNPEIVKDNEIRYMNMSYEELNVIPPYSFIGWIMEGNKPSDYFKYNLSSDIVYDVDYGNKNFILDNKLGENLDNNAKDFISNLQNIIFSRKEKRKFKDITWNSQNDICYSYKGEEIHSNNGQCSTKTAFYIPFEEVNNKKSNKIKLKNYSLGMQINRKNFIDNSYYNISKINISDENVINLKKIQKILGINLVIFEDVNLEKSKKIELSKEAILSISKDKIDDKEFENSKKYVTSSKMTKSKNPKIIKFNEKEIKNPIIYEIMYRGYMFKLVGDENLYQNQEIKDLIVYLKSLEQYM
ncbi:hypothetical protein [Leptotrichia sp. oral taxon 847]|uniref:hypothetical protein n=1 Tax=Leptotrichia sp. oral taxon 847 TaxID=1785996 RepID=UPI000767DF74|nr:hypothetical protein [Leptotrichia sp. oral taxon 847]AMD95492.1 hypothetical protein AXF11_07830 [Leptotrichia sp. oral taxon 847]